MVNFFSNFFNRERSILAAILTKNTARWRLEFKNHKIHKKSRNSQKKTQNSQKKSQNSQKLQNSQKITKLKNHKIH